jgi:hypothetical protein
LTDVRLGHVFASVVNFTEGIIKKQIRAGRFFHSKEKCIHYSTEKESNNDKNRERKTMRDKNRQRETVGDRGTKTK